MSKGYKPTAGTPKKRFQPRDVAGVKVVPKDNGFRAVMDTGNAVIEQGNGKGSKSKTMDEVVAHLNGKIKISGVK